MLESTTHMSDCTVNSARGTRLKYIYIQPDADMRSKKMRFPNAPIIQTFF